MAEGIITLNDESFKAEVLEAERPVLVDFWAAWCGPCRVMAPVLGEMAKDFGEKVKVAKLNVDDNIDTAAQYEVRSIPTFILFEKGEVKKKLIGAMPKQKLLEELSDWLK